jgi:hypothetical protein
MLDCVQNGMNHRIIVDLAVQISALIHFRFIHAHKPENNNRHL